MAEPLVQRVMAELKVKEYAVESRIAGSKLVGLHYEHPFLKEVVEHKKHTGKNHHAILPAEYVTLEDGTGCVHTAPGHGPTIFSWARNTIFHSSLP